MPEKFAGKFGEGEKASIPEPSDGGEKAEEKETKELHLSPEEREVVMKKFEEFINPGDKRIVRFINSGELDSYVEKNRISGEVYVYEGDEFPSVFKKIIKEVTEKENGKLVGSFWSDFAESHTDWPLSCKLPGSVGNLLSIYVDGVKRATPELKAQGERNWRRKAREAGVKRVLSRMVAASPFIMNLQVRDFLNNLSSFLQGEREEYKEAIVDFRGKLSQTLDGLRKSFDLPEKIVEKKIMLELLNLAQLEDPVQYFVEQPREFRKFIQMSSVIPEIDLEGFLPYELMLVLKLSPNTKFRQNRIMEEWGRVSQSLDDSLQAAISMVPERTFVQETVQKLREFYDQGKKAEVLFPLFDARLNPRWPNDPEVLAEMKKKIAEIRQQIKDEQAEKQKNQTKEEE